MRYLECISGDGQVKRRGFDFVSHLTSPSFPKASNELNNLEVFFLLYSSIIQLKNCEKVHDDFCAFLKYRGNYIV